MLSTALDFIRNFLSCSFTCLSTCLNRNRIWDSFYATIYHKCIHIWSMKLWRMEYSFCRKLISLIPFKQKSCPSIWPKQIQPFLFDKRMMMIRLKVNRKEYLVQISQFSGCPIAIVTRNVGLNIRCPLFPSFHSFRMYFIKWKKEKNEEVNVVCAPFFRYCNSRKA